jgi:hypothetical protein
MCQRSRWLVPLIFALVLPLSVGPIPATATPASQLPSQIRVVNALPFAPAVDVVIDGVEQVPGMPYGANPPYSPVAPGPHTVVLTPPGLLPPVPLVITELAVAPGGSYTLFAIGPEGAPMEFLAMADQPLGLTAGAATARFVHASPNTPPLDLAITGGPVLFSNIGFGQASPYLVVPAGPLDLEARLAGTPVVVLDIPAVGAAPGGVYTFAALGLTGAVPPLGFLALSDF